MEMSGVAGAVPKLEEEQPAAEAERRRPVLHVAGLMTLSLVAFLVLSRDSAWDIATAKFIAMNNGGEVTHFHAMHE